MVDRFEPKRFGKPIPTAEASTRFAGNLTQEGASKAIAHFLAQLELLPKPKEIQGFDRSRKK